MDINVNERIKKAKIKLQSENPFFSYLSLFLDFKESNDLPDYAGMGVNERGELFYKKEFVEGLTDKELIGAITHEILHLSLLHLLRIGNRDKMGWNIATDLVTNSLLELNGFSLPDDCLIPNYDNNFSFENKVIEKINEKTAEQIYQELPKEHKQGSKKGYYVVVDSNGKKSQGFDEHIEIEGLTKEEEQKLKDEWEERVCSAYVTAKQRGQLPNGMERLIGKLHEEKIDWKTLLRRYILREIPSYCSWNRRNKKSIGLGVYLPEIVKEKIDIGVMINCSGSIGQKELIDFLSEIVGIARAYKNQINMKLFTHDTEIQTELSVENGNIDKIMKMEVKGGGGTSFNTPYQELLKKNPDMKVLVWLSDGYGDTINRSDVKIPILWVLTENGSDNLIKDTGQVLRLEK